MKRLYFYSFFFISILLTAQDKIYFLDGACKTGKVLEIGVDEIKVESQGNIESFYKGAILLIEYRNGVVEKYNMPEKTVVYNPAADNEKETQRSARKPEEISAPNQVYINTLALCNSDVAIFYERLLAGKRLGIGMMGAYNFNREASLMNTYIFILTSSKKNYDLGAFLNIYLNDPKQRTAFYLGVLLKYTQFSYTSVFTDSARVGNVYVTNTRYIPASGGQFATLFTFGSHTAITKDFFVKTVFGLGGFNLHGTYKQQYNLQANSGVNTGSQFNRTLLPKLYLGVSAGFNF